MAEADGRYRGPAFAAAEGWQVERLTQPSRLMGANGLRTGTDGRIYVAQVAGSQVCAVDPDSGLIDIVSPRDGRIVAPDDLAFDDAGNMYATEITDNRVSVTDAKGKYRVLNGDMPVANPITFENGHLYAGECRPGGRVMELDRESGAARMILEDVPMPNAFAIGPDGKLYMPIMGTNEIWRVDPAGGEPEVVVGDLGVPDSVKFDGKGRIISTQVASGQVLRIDPQTGARKVLAQLGPGLDNCTFVGERLFVSSIPGEITEIFDDGGTRPLVERGLQWPMGLAVGTDGRLFVADGGFDYMLSEGGQLELIGFLFSPDFPGFTRGVCAGPDGSWYCTTSNGHLARWNVGEESAFLAEGLDIPAGVAVNGGAVIVAEMGSGRVLSVENGNTEELAAGLDKPMGVAVSTSGEIFVAEAAAGRVVGIAGGKSETVLDGLGEPQGLAAAGDSLFVADCGKKELVRLDIGSGRHEVIARHLPLKAPPGVNPNRLGSVGNLSGPMDAFTGVACGPDGVVYVSGDAEGSVLAVRRA